MSPSPRFSFATSGRPCGDPVHGTGLSADIERDLCKEPKVTKLARDGSVCLIHASNAGIRDGGRVDAAPKVPRRRISSTTADAGSPLKTMQLALPELDAAARTSPMEGNQVTLETPKDAIFPVSSSNILKATSSPEKKKDDSLDAVIDNHLASRGYGNRSVVFHRLDQKRTSTVVHYPFTSTNYVVEQESPPAALWAKSEAARCNKGKKTCSKKSEGSKIEEDWQEVGADENDDEWTIV